VHAKPRRCLTGWPSHSLPGRRAWRVHPWRYWWRIGTDVPCPLLLYPTACARFFALWCSCFFGCRCFLGVAVVRSLSCGARNEDVCPDLFPSSPFLFSLPIHPSRPAPSRPERACVAPLVLDLRLLASCIVPRCLTAPMGSGRCP
jgi:hypothetical protein